MLLEQFWSKACTDFKSLCSAGYLDLVDSAVASLDTDRNPRLLCENITSPNKTV